MHRSARCFPLPEGLRKTPPEPSLSPTLTLKGPLVMFYLLKVHQLVTIWMNDHQGTTLLEGWTRLGNISEVSQMWAVNTSPQNTSGQQAGAAMPNSREVAPSRQGALISISMIWSAEPEHCSDGTDPCCASCKAAKAFSRSTTANCHSSNLTLPEVTSFPATKDIASSCCFCIASVIVRCWKASDFLTHVTARSWDTLVANGRLEEENQMLPFLENKTCWLLREALQQQQAPNLCSSQWLVSFVFKLGRTHVPTKQNNLNSFKQKKSKLNVTKPSTMLSERVPSKRVKLVP